jgi:hypothetical protein
MMRRKLWILTGFCVLLSIPTKALAQYTESTTDWSAYLQYDN